MFTEHKRTVNKVNFHPTEGSLLVSASQDGSMSLFDVRSLNSVAHFMSNTESIRDVQFNPHNQYQVASVSEHGKVQLWDCRRPDRWEKQWPGHSEHVFACEWHPEVRGWLATAGRDKLVKVWDTLGNQRTVPFPDHIVHTIGPVGKVKWRPQRRDHLVRYFVLKW